MAKNKRKQRSTHSKPKSLSKRTKRTNKHYTSKRSLRCGPKPEQALKNIREHISKRVSGDMAAKLPLLFGLVMAAILVSSTEV
jgi:hypothetical protein